MKLNKTLLVLFALFFILGAVKIYSQALNENSIKFENVQTATLVGQDGIIMRTEDGGLNWTEQVSGITNVLNSVEYSEYTDENGALVKMLFAVGENGIILKSNDNGTTWEVKQGSITENLNDIIVFSPNQIYICGDNGTLLRSVDYGQNWTAVTLPTTANLNHLAAIGSVTTEARMSAIVVGDNGTCFGTINMEDWFAVTLPTTDNISAVEYFENTVICAGDNGTIIRSINNGTDWTAITSGITTKIYDLKFVNASIVIGSSENGTLVRSEDGGETWVSITAPTESDLFAVNFGSASFGISTGADGTEIYTTDGGITWVETLQGTMSKNISKENVKLNQNYPNPFNPSTVISYSLNDNSTVSIKVFDMTGREVRTLVNSYQGAGTYSVNFNASNLASGIYFYVLRVNTGSNEITKTMRMILTK